ncbi:MAG: CBS domain-containing protein [Deltaproteobacteria bacterium]|nr:MAG: CBS domain-containing protein [Deltaproteobacteria bacterium]
MEVITTHINADFDCLGSMIAAKRLYPDAVMVFPGGQERSLREFFLRSVQYVFGFKRARDIDLEEVTRLILVDVRNASRIGPFGVIAKRPGVDIHIYDHHPAKEHDLKGSLEYVELVGSTVTVFSHLFMEQGVELTSDEATMMMLGLYEDTGSLTFHTTTAKDYQAAAYLLSQGAKLNTVADLIVQEMTPDQVHLLNDLLASKSILNVHGINVAIAHASIDYFVGDIATLAHKLKDMENLDVLFVVVRMESRVFIVARSRIEDVHVGNILTDLGGGGHASAASCSVRDLTLLQVLEQLPKLLQLHIKPQWQARHLMSTPVKSVVADHSVAEAHQILSRYNINAIPVLSKDEVVGIISRQLVDKAVYHGLQEQPVSEIMTSDFQQVSPQTPVAALKMLFVESNQRFAPVVEEGRLMGAITRTDLLRHLASSVGTPPRSGETNLVNRGGRSYRAGQIQRLIRNRLPKRIQDLLTQLGQVADELSLNVFVVGGFVRDLLMNKKNLDLDVVVEGDGVAFAEAFARQNDCRVRSHHKFGTAVLIFPDGFKIDVASARMEYYLRPGALPDVEHASVKMDLSRRDFTINTLAISLNQDTYGSLFDYYGGQRDIDDKVLRVLHNLSFVEDPTRVFRAVRFEQRLGFKIGKQTEHLLNSAVRLGLMEKVSGHRLFSELFLILREPRPLPAVSRLGRLDVLRQIHPKLTSKIDYSTSFDEARRTTDWYDLLYTGQPCERWFCYFLVFTAVLDRDEIKSLSERLQLIPRYRDMLNQQRSTALGILKRLESRPEGMRAPKSSSLYRWFKSLATEILLFMMARTSQDLVRQWISHYITHLRDVQPLLKGHDLETMGFQPGPVYREILDDLLYARLDGRVVSVEDERVFVQKRYIAE